MLIRTEAPADILPIARLVKSAFETEAEANLVMKLRENSHLTLSLVACNDEGEVVGHAMFSPVSVEGEDCHWQGLAPVCVKEGVRNQGIAESLVKEGLSSLLEFGYPVCVVLGDPNYYSRFGFVSAKEKGFKCKWEVPDGAFQIAELAENQLASRSGLIEYCPEFDELG
ncbi:GNAT family N-acetyltransferase [Vibrio genomosp. F10]|uniref:GNAT family N-acetyltransferase n=1 Tax=Vibrio genomosp. F10 TaxID=723171 RepID=UPI000315C9B6|nr:N-acetyltransferase [Vibrio genomosp. F10]OEE86847.1 GNAT family N-acetyltransferase [Vibrio genomosp. F10 str. 9ZD137]